MSKKNHEFCLTPLLQSKFKSSECKSIQMMYIWLLPTSQYTHTFQVRSLAQSAYMIILVSRFETDLKVSKLPEYYPPSLQSLLYATSSEPSSQKCPMVQAFADLSPHKYSCPALIFPCLLIPLFVRIKLIN